MMQGEDHGLKRQIDLCCNKSTFLTVWLLNSIKALWLWDFLPIKQGHFFFDLIVFMYLASCLAKRQHSKNNSSHSMNVIILCMVSFLLLIKKTMSAIIKVQYKAILWFFENILINNIVNSLHLFSGSPYYSFTLSLP